MNKIVNWLLKIDIATYLSVFGGTCFLIGAFSFFYIYLTVAGAMIDEISNRPVDMNHITSVFGYTEISVILFMIGMVLLTIAPFIPSTGTSCNTHIKHDKWVETDYEWEPP